MPIGSELTSEEQYAFQDLNHYHTLEPIDRDVQIGANGKRGATRLG